MPSTFTSNAQYSDVETSPPPLRVVDPYEQQPSEPSTASPTPSPYPGPTGSVDSAEPEPALQSAAAVEAADISPPSEAAAAEETQRYVVACSIVSAAASALTVAHDVGGTPTAPRTDDQDLQRAITIVRGACGGMAAVAARLLVRVREDAGRRLRHVSPAIRPEEGVTTSALIPEEEWRASVRALAAASAECHAAVRELRECSDAPSALLTAVEQLVQLGELAAEVLSKPS